MKPIKISEAEKRVIEKWLIYFSFKNHEGSAIDYEKLIRENKNNRLLMRELARVREEEKLFKTKSLSINVTGNKGGDILRIVDIEDGTIYLESGHNCIFSIKKVVPVEVLTAMISQVMLDNDCDINKVIDSFNWDDGFKKELKSKVRKVEDEIWG